MKISAIICEFNPLHSGHKRIIDYAKSISDKVVCIMSGNFTQRGLPACAEKHQRAKHAILAGADMVVELPTIYATASAENFAYGAIDIANQLDVDYLVFGSESGCIEDLQAVASKLSSEEYNEKIKELLKKGNSYPKAVALAVGSDILDTPNNMLAIEYLKALKATNSKITPVTIQREDNYNSQQTKQYASSSALRKNAQLRPNFTFDYVTTDIDDQVETSFCNYIPHALSTISKQQWLQIEGVTEGIENRFITANKNNGYDALLEQVKTKRYTRAKIQRIALNAVLSITQNDVNTAKQNPTEIVVLAIEENFTQLLYKCSSTSVITKNADALYSSFNKVTPPQKLQKIQLIH